MSRQKTEEEEEEEENKRRSMDDSIARRDPVDTLCPIILLEQHDQ